MCILVYNNKKNKRDKERQNLIQKTNKNTHSQKKKTYFKILNDTSKKIIHKYRIEI